MRSRICCADHEAAPVRGPTTARDSARLAGQLLPGLVLLAGLVCVTTEAAAQPPGVLRLPDPGTTELRVLTTADAVDRQLVLTARTDGTVWMAPDIPSHDRFWVLSPVGRDTYRLQLFDAGQLWSLAAQGPASGVSLVPSARDTRQFWRLVPSLSTAGAVRIESVAFPTRSLAGGRDAVVSLERNSGGPAQNWFLETRPVPSRLALPTVRMDQHAIRPADPLPPATARLVNSQPNELWVWIVDLGGGGGNHLKIPPGEAVDVSLDRDPGATLVETYEVISPLGDVYRDRFVTPLPPVRLYEIAVYERFLQSIAIDRTGKSPDPIEDINYQPKSIGIFPIPPGDAFTGGIIDVFRAAKAADNAGGVPRLVPDLWQQPSAPGDPLQEALEEATRPLQEAVK